MAHLDVAQAAFAGFGVIRRHPLSVLVWALLLFGLTVAPLLLTFGLIAPGLQALITSAAGGVEPTPEQVMALQAQWMTLNPLLGVLSLVARVMLTCAIFRAVLEPGASRFAYLRLGMAELFVGLVAICMVIMVAVGMMVVLAVGGLLTAIVWMGSQEAGMAVMGVAILVSAAAGVWVMLRLSLALPMSFADRNFRLFESWRLTRGHAGGLLLVLLLVIVVVLLLELVVFGLAGGALVAFLMNGTMPDEAAAIAFFSRPFETWAAEVAPWAVAAGLVVCLFAAVFTTLATAPWAAAYRALVPPPAEPEPGAEG